MSAPCKERWKHLKGGRRGWHEMAYSEPVQRREDAVLDSKPANRCCAAPAYLPASAVCLLSPRVFSVSGFLQFYSCQLAKISAEEPAGVRSLPCFINKIASLFWFSIFIVVDEAKWIRKNTAMYTKYKFGNLILMRGNFISCSSGEICCGSRLTANTDLLRGRFPWPYAFYCFCMALLVTPNLLAGKYSFRSD